MSVVPARFASVDALRGLTVAAMLLVAAFIEAYWSSRTATPPLTKYWVGASLWALVALYLIAAGRTRHAPE